MLNTHNPLYSSIFNSGLCLCLCCPPSQVLKELAPYKSLVVATGGGAVTRPKNWSYMHNGIVAWMRGEPSLLARRVVAEGIEKRPLLFGEGVSGGVELLVLAVRVCPAVCKSSATMDLKQTP